MNWLSHGEWVMASLTAIYVVLTGLYALISYKTLKAIQEQGKSSADQFQKQLAAMDKAREQTDKLIAQTIAQVEVLARTAEAASKSAGTAKENLEAKISKDRASINIILGNVVPMSQSHGQDPTKPVLNGVTCQLENCGSSRAIVNDFRGRYLHVTTPNFTPDYRDCHQLRIDKHIEDRTDWMYFLLEPSSTLTEEEVIQIRGGDSSLHFYGFVRYTDVFTRTWKKTFHMQWRIRLGVVLEGAITDGWERVGAPEENQETEETAVVATAARAS